MKIRIDISATFAIATVNATILLLLLVFRFGPLQSPRRYVAPVESGLVWTGCQLKLSLGVSFLGVIVPVGIIIGFCLFSFVSCLVAIAIALIIDCTMLGMLRL